FATCFLQLIHEMVKKNVAAEISTATFFRWILQLFDDRNVFCLQTFLALRYSEFYALSFFECTITITADSAEMNEHIITLISLNKPKPFTIVEPFYCSSFTC